MDDQVFTWLKKECNIQGDLGYLNDWILARGNVMDVVVEVLDMHSPKDLLSKQERELLDIYRCLSPSNKKIVYEYCDKIYEKQCK